MRPPGKGWRMVGHGAKFGQKMEQAIVGLLSHGSLEAAARAVGIDPNTLLRWTKEPEFEAALREARRTAFSQSIARLQDASGAAVTTVLKIMLDQNAPARARLRAAEIVLERGAMAIVMEDFEARVAELERAVDCQAGAQAYRDSDPVEDQGSTRPGDNAGAEIHRARQFGD